MLHLQIVLHVFSFYFNEIIAHTIDKEYTLILTANGSKIENNILHKNTKNRSVERRKDIERRGCGKETSQYMENNDNQLKTCVYTNNEL